MAILNIVFRTITFSPHYDTWRYLEVKPRPFLITTGKLSKNNFLSNFLPALSILQACCRLFCEGGHKQPILLHLG